MWWTMDRCLFSPGLGICGRRPRWPSLTGRTNVDANLLNTLESQHRDAEDLLAQLTNASESSEQQPLVDQLVSALEEHMAIEEGQVYPELERIDGELAEEANVEHGLAREGLSKLQSMVGQPGFGAAVEMVKA